MTRVERGHGAQLTVTVLDGETAVDADEDPTVTFTSWDGTVLAADVATTKPSDTTGVYQVDMAPSAELDLITATWSIVADGIARPITQTIEIVGGFYFDLPELRNRPGMENTARFSTDDLVAARTWAEDMLDREIATSFVERLAVDVLAAPVRCTTLDLIRTHGRRLISLTVDDQDVAGAQLVVDAGWTSVSADTWPTGAAATVAYTAGWSLTPPQDLHDAAIAAARYHLLGDLGDSAIPQNASSVKATPGGSVDLSNIGPTGIPAVDVIIAAYRERCAPPLVA